MGKTGQNRANQGNKLGTKNYLNQKTYKVKVLDHPCAVPDQKELGLYLQPLLSSNSRRQTTDKSQDRRKH